jgi:hypothetical protein
VSFHYQVVYDTFKQAELGLLYLKNPNGSGKTLYIHRLTFGSNGPATVTSYRDPATVVGGSSLAITNRTGGTTTSIAVAHGEVTGSLFTSFSGGILTRRRYIPVNDEKDSLDEGTITILPNQSILWTGFVTTMTHEISANVIWWER